MKQHRLLIIHDTEQESTKGTIGWAFSSRSRAIALYAPPDFLVDRCCSNALPLDKLPQYDIVFNLEAASPQRDRIKRANPKAILVVSFNNGPGHARKDRWDLVYSQADYVIVNNRLAFNYLPRTCNISNGVDTDVFRCITPITQREHRVFWTGGRNPKKGKNLQSVIEPARSMAEAAGFIMDIRPVDDITPEQVLTQQEMVAAYNQASYVICCSSHEGTPNIALEGMACGCVLVSTDVGNVPEFGLGMTNYIPIDPNPESLVSGLLAAKRHRERLSSAGVATMHQWSYGHPGNRADYYFALFRALLSGRTPEPFTYLETPAEHI